MHRPLVAPLIAACLVSACAAHTSMIQVGQAKIDVENAPPVGAPFPGVPMRLQRQQRVQIWRLDPGSNQYTEVAESSQMLADQRRLYSVDVVSDAFSSPQLNITEYPDNTPKSIEVASTENPSAAIDAANTALGGVVTARNTNLTGCAAAKASALSAQQALATAQSSYDGLSSTASSQLRAAYQQVLSDARQQAAFAQSNPLC